MRLQTVYVKEGNKKLFVKVIEVDFLGKLLVTPSDIICEYFLCNWFIIVVDICIDLRFVISVWFMALDPGQFLRANN